MISLRVRDSPVTAGGRCGRCTCAAPRSSCAGTSATRWVRRRRTASTPARRWWALSGSCTAAACPGDSQQPQRRMHTTLKLRGAARCAPRACAWRFAPGTLHELPHWSLPSSVTALNNTFSRLMHTCGHDCCLVRIAWNKGSAQTCNTVMGGSRMGSTHKFTEGISALTKLAPAGGRS